MTRHPTKTLRWAGAATAGLLSTLATASRAEEEPGALVDVHAFVSQSYIVTTTNDWLVPNSTRGSFDLSEGGINFTREVTDRMRIGAQLFAQFLNPTGNYVVRMDWIYLDYRFWDWLGLRAGREKIPFGLYSEFADIDAARAPVLLPQSIYPIQVREFFLAQTGLDVYGRIELHAGGALDYSAYVGTLALSTTSISLPPAVIDSIDVPYVAGGRVMWETPLDGLRLGGSFIAVRADGTFHVGSVPFDATFNQSVWVASIEYTHQDLLLAVEYEQRDMRFRASVPTPVPIPSNVSPGGYAMANYRVTPWLQLSAYYSLNLESFHKPEHSGDAQNDFAGTLRFDINPYWLVKLEAHYLYGTEELGSVLMGNTAQLDTLQPRWAAFLARTTATF